MPLFAWTASAAATEFVDETGTGFSELGGDKTGDTWLTSFSRRFSQLVNGHFRSHPDPHKSDRMRIATDLLEENVGDVKISEWQATMILFKSSFGIGMLSLPYAFSKSGMVPGMIAICIIAKITNFSTKLLVWNKRKLQSGTNSVLGIPDIAYLCWGWPGLAVASAVIICCQVGNCIAYTIFLALTTSSLLEESSAGFGILQESESPFIPLALCWAVLFSFLVQMKELKTYAPLLFTAQIAHITAVITIIFYGLLHDHVCGEVEVKVFCSVRVGTHWETFPIFLGIAVFAVEGIPMVLAIENSMATPERFETAFDRAQICLVSCFLAFGVMGYWLYGDNTKSVIVLNVLGTTGLMVKALLCLVISLSYPLQFMPAGEVLKAISESSISRSIYDAVTLRYFHDMSYLEWKEKFWMVLKVCAVLGGAWVAIIFPHFGHFLSILGSITFSLITFFLPPLFYLQTFHWQVSNRMLAACLLTSCFGVAVTCVGLWSNLLATSHLQGIEHSPPNPTSPEFQQARKVYKVAEGQIARQIPKDMKHALIKYAKQAGNKAIKHMIEDHDISGTVKQKMVSNKSMAHAEAEPPSGTANNSEEAGVQPAHALHMAQEAHAPPRIINFPSHSSNGSTKETEETGGQRVVYRPIGLKH
uniref:Amino acid transporter transmembrane domain-containing protein n=1 Tax=Guillardia theta TaxID=55529 RepID=A0A7S4KZA6_GUITH